jgi:hypothetical protein
MKPVVKKYVKAGCGKVKVVQGISGEVVGNLIEQFEWEGC